ncbi:abortive infection system antitoxin AbiGi family protein [Ferrovum myxofaciens]|uniref:abortive infection system antitoxin AbiGi family protein n=1 Tax=Ferrovum myxofaciens TaxID=416213 RepID=UPI0004E0DB5F|nr:abortive infection system antitoxin AbiGi family protein [Ferrovum myxofaciens]
MQERFFYHSFPRRGSSTKEEAEKGCKILAAIRDFGLLLTPETIEWKQPSVGNAQPRIFPLLQKRVCFTELSPSEISEHAEKFGHFALEFEIDTVRRLGAAPVFYVPQPTSNAADGSSIGTSLLAMAMDSHAIIQRMATLNQVLQGPTPVSESFNFDVGFARSPDGRGSYSINRDEAKNLLAAIGHAVTPWNDLNAGTFALLNFFYPTDNKRQDRSLEYYRQREWRIACNFRLNNSDGTSVDVLHVPTQQERARFLDIDKQFFERQISTDTGMAETLEQSLVCPGLHGKRLIEMVRRIVVPDEAICCTKEILAVLPESVFEALKNIYNRLN